MSKQSAGASVVITARGVMKSAMLMTNNSMSAILMSRKAQLADNIGDRLRFLLAAVAFDVCAKMDEWATRLAIKSYRYSLGKYDTPKGRKPLPFLQDKDR